MADNSTKICPFCAETIKTAAIICRYCQRDLPPHPVSSVEASKQYSDLVDFIRYQLQDNRKQALHTFVARAQERDDVPRFVRMLPIGGVFIYNNFIAFLSLAKGLPGRTMMYQDAIQEISGVLQAGAQMYEWVASPSSVLKSIGEYLSSDYKREDVLAEALMNRNSFFVNLDDLEAVEAGSRGILGNYIRIHTHEKDYLICQETGEESFENFGLGGFKVWYTMLSKKWQTEVISLLQSRIQQKRSQQ